jgi:acyl-CoA synthetase (NDP forming)
MRARFTRSIPTGKDRERACLPSVDALPDGVDVAVLAIPRAFVLDTIKGLPRAA